MICAPLMAESVEQMLSGMHQAKTEGADVVEIRLDCITNFQPHRDLKLLLENKPLPVVVVYGPTWEGGEYEGDEQERLQALLLAKDLGADYIELELKSIGAVNTIVRRPDDGKLVGHNTDCEAGITAIEDALKETLRDYKLVFDAVYTPRKTRLLKEAEAAGAIVVS
ncbi:UNVERIFIED_CONTAM: Bifunctional 3-dehydroquinate dehydratase/shikimate dehydrogenase, chloroplastic [Sesamum radiatum]|uniref:Bifunctional 3-dehydroquinate dehydratase/shikimate dehydrogenase, chloroplastic n=1 Tax=Sesamum radiatum TaxID=300843 RepID=A0AAW2VJU9_SESRA